MWVPFKEKTSYGTSGFPGCLHTSLHLFARAREIGRYNHHRSFFQERSGRISMHITLSGLLFLIYQSMLWSFILITVIEAWQRYLGGALKQKYVLRYRKGKMQRALPNSSFPPIHLFIWIFTSTEDKAHLLQQISHFLLLFLEFSQPFFVNAFRPLFAKPWVRKVQDCRGLGSLNRHSSRRYIHTHLSCARLGPKTVAHCPDPSPIHLPCLAS